MAAHPAQIHASLKALGTFLQQKKSEDLSHVTLSPDSLSLLRGMPDQIRSWGESLAAQNTTELRAVMDAPKAEEAPLSEQSSPASSAVLDSTVNESGWIDPPGESRRDQLNNLFRMAKSDEACRSLGTLRDTLVFATGNPEADLMFVGEAPGAEEEKLKKPFVGPAGKKLDQIISAMGLSRDDVYISNIVKYRPLMGDPRMQGARNRKPTPEEMAISVKFVKSEIRVVQPKVIVALGGTAAEGLLDLNGSVSSMRGQVHRLDSFPVVVTYHPSYLLRQESEPDPQLARREKRKVWEDMLEVMGLLEMEISEKQRAFFT